MRKAGLLVEGCLSTLLPRHNESTRACTTDRATAQRTAVQLKSGGRRLLRKVISSNECTGALWIR